MINFRITMFSFLTTAVLIFACSSPKNNLNKQAKNYSPVSKDLYDTIALKYSMMFNAFNARNIDKLKTFFAQDLEFYHDLGGVTNYQQNMEAFKRNFENDRRVRRELVAGSLEVYPIKDYGAVETGVHQFYGTAKGEKEKLGSEAKFVNIWRKKDGEWKIIRVISYAHEEY